MDTQDDRIFEELLGQRWPELPDETRTRIVRFRRQVVLENERQNLTRLLSCSEFYEGHILDCRALLETGWISEKMMDLGSGVGVPGLLLAILENSSHWILAESEGHKAEFLRRSAMDLGLDKRVAVFGGRGEAYLQSQTVNGIVARAIGPVLRIYSWIRECSTWNNLILFKGPGWEREWEEFQGSRFRRELLIKEVKTYSVGPEMKTRLLVHLRRVPRGT